MKLNLTLLLVITNVLLFFLMSDGLILYEYYALEYGFSIKNFLEGRYHTIITSMFLHGDVIHLFWNMLWLFFLGISLEAKVKKWQYLLTYFLAGIFGNLVIFIPIFGYSKETIAIGASAAISGLVGLGTFICPGRLVLFGSLIPLPFVLAGALYFIFTLSMLFAPSIIAYPAHLAGLVVGAIFGLAWGEQRVKRLFIFILICLLIISLPYLIEFVIG